MPGPLETFAAQGALRDLDLHFARFMGECAEAASAEFVLAAALVSRATGDGHICINLAALAGQPISVDPEMPSDDVTPAITAPALNDWLAALTASGVVGHADSEADAYPLVLDAAHRLYLARYWRYEQDLAASLRARIDGLCDGVDEARLAQGLARLFPEPNPDPGPDWQKIAAAAAVLKRFTVISGGPGTGKTTTVTRLLALLIDQRPLEPPRIALAAPTGKAAARLTESIRGARGALDADPGVIERIPTEATTLHRLLGWRPGGYRHDTRHPLHLDVLVVDEASMVDLPMMARVAAALPAPARLVLLGDKDQLASVEAGNVLGDICGGGADPAYSADLHACLCRLAGLPEDTPAARAAIADSVVLLTRSYRFGTDSGIGRLARCVNEGDADAARALLDSGDYSDIGWQPFSASGPPAALLNEAAERYRAFLEAPTPTDALAALNRFRVLCALKHGPLGVNAVNRAIEQRLARLGLIRPGHRWYAGRPIMVTRNDYGLRLYNGDVGIVLPDHDAGGRLTAFFPTPDGGLRRVFPRRLSAVETVFAMTVHKSQGSEFGEVLLMLPGADAPVMTRELVYTGITRAREHVTLCGVAPALDAVRRRTRRRSGLRDALWGDADADTYNH